MFFYHDYVSIIKIKYFFALQCHTYRLKYKGSVQLYTNKRGKMQYFIMNFFDNKTQRYKRKEVKFDGDLQTAIIFAKMVAKRLKLYDYKVSIFDQAGYLRGRKCIKELNINNKKDANWRLK